jgi:heme-degrading monooxygenase HmoA
MITRIVKLTFQEERVDDFLNFFESIKNLVNEFPGCKGMQLVQDKSNPCIIFTYSQWNSETDLNAYRDSETFGGVWPKIKLWFGGRPEAWTTQVVFNGFENK